jgi:hypothetical protein
MLEYTFKRTTHSIDALLLKLSLRGSGFYKLRDYYNLIGVSLSTSDNVFCLLLPNALKFHRIAAQ